MMALPDADNLFNVTAHLTLGKMLCPQCGMEMEKGMISSDANILSWTKGISSVRGETLSWGVAACLKGHRCTQCRLIMVKY